MHFLKYLLCAAPFLLSLSSSAAEKPTLLAANLTSTPAFAPPVTFVAKDYASVLRAFGLEESDILLQKSIYQSFVDNSNTILELLSKMPDRTTPEWAGLKRRFSWEFDGMRLTELCYENMNGSGAQLDPNSALYKAIVASFGSYETWLQSFRTTWDMHGTGWVVLCQDARNGTLYNCWINDNNTGILAGSKILLVIDATNYVRNIQNYLVSFLGSINWNAAIQRYNEQPVVAPAPFTAKDYSYLLGMQGFSNEALNMHFKLYQGYVANANLMVSILNKLPENSSPTWTEVKRRFGWEYDGMYLHELYFENLGGNNPALDKASPLYAALVANFGSYEAWEKDFRATGLMRGVGWVALYQDLKSGLLLNCWIDEHDLGHLAGGKPILLMDVWEHAYLSDYGLNRADYISAFFNNINWNTVANRYTNTTAAGK